MGGVKKYFKKEFSANKFCMDHDSARDFYLACWQRNRTVLPLLFIRTLIFVGCAGTVITSMIITARVSNMGTWFIFLTHWGLVFNLIASVFALVVSVKAFFIVNNEVSSGLPWYVKTYWVFYNIATPIAFFITIFYWTFLTDFETDEASAINLVLDIFIHLVNSMLMLALVLVSRHPTNLLHFYWPVSVALIYMFFTIIFHFSGAKSPFDTSWIYPMMDWNEPGTTVAVVIGSAVGLIIIQSIIVLITLVRDKLTRKFRETNSITISNEYPISYNHM